MHQASLSRRGSLLAATSLALFFLGAGAANAKSASDSGLEIEATESILANHLVPVGPANVLPGTNAANNGSIYSNSVDVLDTAGSINGVGQMILVNTGVTLAAGGTGTFLGLCTGSLINPRTVITAAHCVYNDLIAIAANGASINIPRAAHEYGSNTGTANVPISFGFESLNRNCLNGAGLPAACPAGQKGPYETWRDAGFQTSVARRIFNGNQVWYQQDSNPLAGGEFANMDIALVTLDTHARGIPTWTMLFSPLDGPTHATITGYGTAGVGLSGIGNLAGIDYRRRSAENMIDAVITINEFNTSPGISPTSTAFAAFNHPIYWMDFDDPTHNPAALPANFAFQTPVPAVPVRSRYYDFNGLGGVTLANEGSTGGGDSGGPLVIDQRWDRSVIAGVLTGSFSFNGGIGLYGQFNTSIRPCSSSGRTSSRTTPTNMRRPRPATAAGSTPLTGSRTWIRIM